MGSSEAPKFTLRELAGKVVTAVGTATLVPVLRPFAAFADAEPATSAPFVGSTEYALLKDSIPDAIAAKDLEDHNVFIHPSPNTDLVIRRSALDEKTLLSSVYHGAGKDAPKLRIVLVDAPYLVRSIKPNLAVPEEFRESLENALIAKEREAISQRQPPVGMLEGFYTKSGGEHIIYLATGGFRQPIADYSYQTIQDLTMRGTTLLTAERIKQKDPSILTSPGFISLGDEVMVNNALNVGMVLRRLLDENSKSRKDTDLDVFAQYSDASERYQQTGDNSGFPYVFVSETGLTYT